jgi:aminoglycoside 3-N-acetyltransferase
MKAGIIMHTRSSLLKQLENMGIDPHGTLLVHSSLKSIGEVEGGADTVLDVLSEYMQEGLLVLPAHTWSYINALHPRFSVLESPSCVGILPELFRKRPGVIRSWHPTHSVAARGADAAMFTAGEQRWDTPCARGSVYGKLLDRKAEIMLLGVDLRRNTFIHGIEEWVDIPGRMTDGHEQLYTVTPDGEEIPVPSRRHSGLSWSQHFWKVESVLEDGGALRRGSFGDAAVMICGTVETTEILSRMLAENPDLFSDNEPLSGGTVPEALPKTNPGIPQWAAGGRADH